MADYDRYQEHRGYRGRYRDRDREARLDDRTGMSPGSPGGYRARYEEDRDRYGYREPGYNAYPDESRSFSSEDYGRAPRGGRNYYRSEGERGREGRYDEREYRPGRGYQSYPFSPYQDFYAGPEGYAGPGYSETYGGNQLYEGASDRSLEAYRGQPSGQFAYPYGRGRADRAHPRRPPVGRHVDGAAARPPAAGRRTDAAACPRHDPRLR